MFWITVILVLVLIGLSLINTAVQVSRQKAYNNIDVLYDKMELYVMQHNITPSTGLIEYLKSFKSLKVNKDLADICVLFVIMTSIPREKFDKSKMMFRSFSEGLPQELIGIAKEFNNEVDKVIKLSLFKPDVFFFFASIVLKGLLKQLSKDGNNKVARFRQNLKEIFLYDNLIASYSLNKQLPC